MVIARQVFGYADR